MKNKFFFGLLLSILFSACQGTSTQKHVTNKDSIADTKATEIDTRTTTTTEWLTRTIENYFADDKFDMANITTSTYYEFKMDAMNVELAVDGALTEQEFVRKWGDKFDLSTHPLHIGFLISGQDWGKITVTKCIPIPPTHTDTLRFDVTISDSILKADYHRQLAVIQINNQNLIADVLEYD